MTDETKGADPFESADYYECSDCFEDLSHETPEEAMESYLDGDMSPDCDVEAIIRQNTPLVCTAFARKTVDPGDAKRWAERFADLLNEWWPEDEYGNPEAEGGGPGDNAFIEAVMPVIDAAIKRTEVWQCEKVGTREYSFEEVLAMMKEHCSWWFEKEPEAAPVESS